MATGFTPAPSLWFFVLRINWASIWSTISAQIETDKNCGRPVELMVGLTKHGVVPGLHSGFRQPSKKILKILFN